MTPSKNVTERSKLSHSDGTIYTGQALSSSEGVSRGHGYGELYDPERLFHHCGQFRYGKPCGQAIFTAPNNDKVYANWDEQTKRHGIALSYRSSDGAEFIEHYEHGKMIKRTRRRPLHTTNQTKTTIFWLSINAINELYPNLATDCGVGRSGHSCCYDETSQQIVVFGGEIQQQATTASSTVDAPPVLVTTNDLLIYDIRTSQWSVPTTTGICPPAISGHTCTLTQDNRMFIIGGQSNGLEVNSSVYILDLKSYHWTGPFSRGLPLTGHSATLINDMIVVIVQSSVFTLDINTLQWNERTVESRSLLRSYSKSTISHSAIAKGIQIFVYGGKTLSATSTSSDNKYERCSNELRVLDTLTWSWSIIRCSAPKTENEEKTSHNSNNDYSGGITIGTWATPRAEHTACLLSDNWMCIIGGISTLNPELNVICESPLNDIQMLNLQTFQWKNMKNDFNPLLFIEPRSNHSVFVRKYDDGNEEILLFGGSNNACPALQDWQILRTKHHLNIVKKTEKTIKGKDKQTNQDHHSIQSDDNINSTSNATSNITAAPTSNANSSSVSAVAGAAGSGNVLALFAKRQQQQQQQK